MTHLFDFKGGTNPPNAHGRLGELGKIPIRRRTHTLLESVRRVGGFQERFDFGHGPKTVGDKLRGFDEANLRCARIILADQQRYDQPDSHCVIIWACTVIARLRPEESGSAA